MNVSRPVLRWHGGKWLLAPWIIKQMPEHKVYVEPFGGAASVLLRKPRSYAEVYNDLDDDVTNLFSVLRSPHAGDLVRLLEITPFSKAEFYKAYEVSDDPIERARRLIVRSFMGFGSNGHARKTGFRSNSNRSGTTPAHDWRNYPEQLSSLIDRLRGVVILNDDAWKVMEAHDAETTLHYVDPPYMPETRDAGRDYKYELTPDQHVALLEQMKTLKGKVILSGYPSACYDDVLSGWRRVERRHLADGARERTEVLWFNFENEGDLFANVG